MCRTRWFRPVDVDSTLQDRVVDQVLIIGKVVRVSFVFSTDNMVLFVK